MTARNPNRASTVYEGADGYWHGRVTVGLLDDGSPDRRHPERTVMGIMGWSSTAMAARYQHVTDPIRHVVAAQVGGLLWADEKTSHDAN